MEVIDRIDVQNDPVNFIDPWGLDIDNSKGKTPVFYKGEHDNDVHEVKPGKNYEGNHDGVVEPSTGDVYKTRGNDYYQDDVSIDKNGNIHGINSLVGSKKLDEKWLKERQKEDSDWDQIFEKARDIKSRCN